MGVYKKMYLSLFNAVTDALELLPEKPEQAKELLIAAQQLCENIFVEEEPASPSD